MDKLTEIIFGWLIGNIKYYSNQLSEFKIDFQDSTSDYIQLGDIAGTEIILQGNLRDQN